MMTMLSPSFSNSSIWLTSSVPSLTSSHMYVGPRRSRSLNRAYSNTETSFTRKERPKKLHSFLWCSWDVSLFFQRHENCCEKSKVLFPHMNTFLFYMSSANICIAKRVPSCQTSARSEKENGAGKAHVSQQPLCSKMEKSFFSCLTLKSFACIKFLFDRYFYLHFQLLFPCLQFPPNRLLFTLAKSED